jgi:hypothetical protein
MGTRRLRLPALLGGVLIAGLAATLWLGRAHAVSEACEPVFPTPNRPNGLDLAYLKAYDHHMPGNVALDSEAVTSRYISRDPRNFAVEVSVGEFANAFGLPATDAQNIFYGQEPTYRNDPSRRVILVFSYGAFDWTYTGDTAAGASGSLNKRYRVAMGAIDAQSGSVIVDQTPACK